MNKIPTIMLRKPSRRVSLARLCSENTLLSDAEPMQLSPYGTPAWQLTRHTSLEGSCISVESQGPQKKSQESHDFLESLVDMTNTKVARHSSCPSGLLLYYTHPFIVYSLPGRIVIWICVCAHLALLACRRRSLFAHGFPFKYS